MRFRLFQRRTIGPDSPVAALVRAARSEDRYAFELLYGRYRGVIASILLAKLPPGEVDDLVQEVFLTAIERLPQLADDAAFGGWICQIARNRARDHHRTRRTVVPLDPELSRPPGQRDTVAARQALDAIRALPDAYTETLIMRLVEGLTGPEIAARTGMTPGSVRVNLSRGMKLLRAELGAQPPQPPAHRQERR